MYRDVCVCLSLLQSGDQVISDQHSEDVLQNEDILANPHSFKGLFEGLNLVFRFSVDVMVKLRLEG